MSKIGAHEGNETLQLIADTFTQSVVTTLQIQCKYPVKPGKSLIFNTKSEVPSDFVVISSVLTLSGNRFNGTVALCFGKEIFLALISAILGQPILEIDGELEDSAGEILNMVFGTAKSQLEGPGYTFKTAIPTVIKGEKVQIRSLKETSQIVIPFTGKDGKFELRLGSCHES